MFKAFTTTYGDLPLDVDRMTFETEGIDEYYEDYLVVQVEGKTIFCRPESGLSDGTQMLMDIMELAYYLGVLDGIKHKERQKVETREDSDALCPYCGVDVWWTILDFWNGRPNATFGIVCPDCGKDMMICGNPGGLTFTICRNGEQL